MNKEHGDDEFLQIVDKAMEEFSLATRPGAYLADVFPIREECPLRASILVPLIPSVPASQARSSLVSRGPMETDGAGLAERPRTDV